MSQRCSRLHFRLYLLWTCRRAAVLAPLCLNVQREVCGFLARFQMIAYCSNTDLLLVDVYSRTASRLSFKDKGIAYCPSVVVIDYMKFLLSGGMKRKVGTSGECDAFPNAFLWDGGVVSPLSSMNESRMFHTLLYVESENAVFAFGGYYYYRGSLASSEKYSLTTDTWTLLPKMSAKCPSPLASQYRDFLYICNSQNVDLLDLRRNELTPICSLSLIHSSCSFSLIASRDSLLLLGECKGERFDFATQTWRDIPSLRFSNVAIDCSVRVGGLEFVLTDASVCVCVDPVLGARRPKFDFFVPWRRRATTETPLCRACIPFA